MLGLRTVEGGKKGWPARPEGILWTIESLIRTILEQSIREFESLGALIDPVDAQMVHLKAVRREDKEIPSRRLWVEEGNQRAATQRTKTLMIRHKFHWKDSAEQETQTIKVKLEALNSRSLRRLHESRSNQHWTCLDASIAVLSSAGKIICYCTRKRQTTQIGALDKPEQEWKKKRRKLFS